MSNPQLLAALAHPRSNWPTAIARWSTSGALGLDLLTCLSATELTAALASGRDIDAVLLDGASVQVDRDLVGSIARHGSVPVGVEAASVVTDWEALGVTGVLGADFDAAELTSLLGRICDQRAVGSRRLIRASLDQDETPATTISVCGPGGAGTSVVAMALAQGMAQDAGSVVLLDGAVRGHLAMYHDVGDVIPGLGDLVARSRRSTIDPAELNDLDFATRRGYRLILGATSVRESHSLPQAATAEALDVIRRYAEVLVVDHDGDLVSGPLSTSLIDRASVWVVAIDAGIKGVHDGARFTAEALDAGVPAERVLLVCNRTRRSDPSRATLRSQLRALLGAEHNPVQVVFLPRVRLEGVHRDAVPFPRSLVDPVATAVRQVLADQGTVARAPIGPTLIEAVG